MNSPFIRRPWNVTPAAPLVAALVLSVGTFGCNQVQTNASEATADFQGTATTTYTWQVEYVPRSPGQDRPNDRRLEQFESTTLTTTNGIRPDAAGSGPDSKGLWWPPLPPEPTVDDIEARLRSGETARSPEIIKSTDYTLSFNQAGEAKTLPTDYEVYRQSVRAFERDRPLQLTLGPQDNSVIQAEIQ
ncbi:hypothetical protein [cf. Phormidesmis sp. LEGE 11477]|uniref:hypothetical protein n=1 Tax=cf. Phormidesmis sp. LEGE 11477 TaxID=1828680 RepID=UPI0018808212|nr:hypothetical protein [cf. Phormidesmis sp. LEGE 11477]MBE9062805.1 hypothetical protein [cf. Phormidesmis sp. LEGE 11477]